MVDLADDPSFQEGQVDEAMKSAQSSRRGRKPLPLQWSRVIDLQRPGPHQAEGFNIDEDCTEALENAPRPPRPNQKPWRPFFHPKAYWKELGFKDLEDNKLSVQKLKAHAKTTS